MKDESAAKLTIVDIKDHIARVERALKLRSATAAKAFPGLTGPSKLSRLAMPTAVLQMLLQWLWLSWHAGSGYESVLKVARLVIERSLEAQTLASNDEMRAQHDVFVLLAAILSGDVALMRKAADGCISANPSSKAKQFYKAWSGVLKTHVLDERESETGQLSQLVKDRGLGLFAEPSPGLVKAFGDREYADLNREIGKAIERNRKEAKELGAVIGTNLFLSESNTIFRFTWPWPEAAFAKLAIGEGASLALDDLWIPKGFIVNWWERSRA